MATTKKHVDDDEAMAHTASEEEEEEAELSKSVEYKGQRGRGNKTVAVRQ